MDQPQGRPPLLPYPSPSHGARVIRKACLWFLADKTFVSLESQKEAPVSNLSSQGL